MECLRRDASEERRTKENPCDDLSDYRRLADPPEQSAQDLSGNDNRGERQQQVPENVRPTRRGEGRGRCRRRRRQRLAKTADDEKPRDAADDHGAVGGCRPGRVARRRSHR